MRLVKTALFSGLAMACAGALSSASAQCVQAYTITTFNGSPWNYLCGDCPPPVVVKKVKPAPGKCGVGKFYQKGKCISPTKAAVWERIR
ncbi:hypothetical protein Rvan_1014 [Rhodomicrobium vannielii ATCC 17100]|jgi:hypothetical protein|uniref:Uncharacterized protein n=1 Tax=Rhodomicrobium vannielii (strain ATCC 17100 / DSM 162 / LMG 4299 / NCIMB 10020 / ATH 3.1.1) TaxID=648757 RepID=E3I2Z4_RHOVT|nr:hypothetical protein [Rhodomicrobium vannielii]ADP70288.1 hypothetical protein Rvan_1014 [Rhodomicrobium vannielii ATCC 17100]